ncbi:MAG: hypothetical protein K940chlam3_00763 [Chlamydiae bacterium]|nr:hypothetical protein [Chlamydiota bacterium]
MITEPPQEYINFFIDFEEALLYCLVKKQFFFNEKNKGSMRTIKSERLKKLEGELQDLEQWLRLSLVPKKDIEKHKEEIALVKEKIRDEMDRLQILKESGDVEDYVAPKRTTTRTGFTEMPSIPDIDMAESNTSYENESEETNADAEDKTDAGEEESEAEESIVEEESYFSDKNRWKRGGIIDPEANEW